MALEKKSPVDSKQTSWVQFTVRRYFVVDVSCSTNSRLTILTHSSWSDLRMAGMLVADGAFGLIGWDTKTKRSRSCLIQVVSFQITNQVGYLL